MVQVVDAHGVAFDASAASTALYGYKIYTNKAVTFLAITKDASDNSTVAYLRNTSNTILQQANYSGNVATFNYALANATTYVIDSNASGGSRTVRRTFGGSYPQNETNVNYTESWVNGAFGGAGTFGTIVSVTTEEIVGGSASPQVIGDGVF